jgi:hypothetical protein
MSFDKKTEEILKNKSGQDAIIEMDDLLSPIFYDNPDKLTKCEKNIVYIEELEREINNGGFNQYFFNSSGDFAMEAINALKIIGSKIFLEILQEAVNKFPDKIVPKDRYERQELLKKIDKNIELWEELDNRFYKYEEDIYGLMIKYIHKNINEFR